MNAGVSADNNGDVYLYGGNLGLENQTTGNVSIIKMNGQNGNQIYVKNDFNIPTYQFIPVFDNNNNLYVFTEPMAGSSSTFFSTGSLNIPLNEYGTNSLLMKFDSIGNPIFGKNFFLNVSSEAFSWINDAQFDGVDLIVTGTMATFISNPFLSMNGTQIPNVYGKNYGGNIAKIDLNGNIKWEKDIQSSQNLSNGMYTNIALDEQENIYAYLTFKEKIYYNNTEYVFGSSPENKVIAKWDKDGKLSYFKPVDNTGNTYLNFYYYNLMDVIEEDSFNILGYSGTNYFLNYPLNNSATPKMYIATFKGENLQTNDNQIFSSKIFPNPTSDILNIETKQTISIIEIFDLSGKLLKSGNGKDKKVSVSNLTKGMYLIKLYTENGVVNSKFIKK